MRVHPRALALWHLCYIINLKGLDNKLQVHGRQAEGAGGGAGGGGNAGVYAWTCQGLCVSVGTDERLDGGGVPAVPLTYY